MSTTFLSQDVWIHLKRAVRDSRVRCLVAVAYFGVGASRLLPLPRGSCLVVDASDRTVATGQTCPADLLALQRRGVAIYSVPNLHAKVYVLGRTAYIGSANVSQHSTAQLVEALIRTTESEAVQAAREFVLQYCLHELTPTVLKRLTKLYRPPHIPGGRRGKRPQAHDTQHPMLPRLLLARLKRVDWPESEQAFHDAGWKVATKHRKRSRAFQLESFRFTGKCPYTQGDVVIQITDEGDGAILASPPGNVLHVRTYRKGNRHVSFVYLELRANKKRRSVKALRRQLGRGSVKRLQKQGIVRDKSFARSLLNLWAR